MLATSRIIMVGESPHAHEQEGIDFAIQELPGTDPYTAWALVELLEPATGRLYEIDLLVLGYSALYLVEIKSGPGKYEGDQVDWFRTAPPDGDVAHPARWLDPPLRLANLKAKILKSRLRSKMARPDRAPRVEPLIFLSNENIDLRLSTDGRAGVVTRRELARAITRHEFPGAPPGWRGERIDAPLQKDVTLALAALGLRKRKGKPFAGQYEIDALLDDGIMQLGLSEGASSLAIEAPPAPSGYQDRVAKHRDLPAIELRARLYLVPQQTSVERRQILRRAAERESQLLHSVSEHKNVLALKDYVPEAPLGPTVLFEAFEGGVPLDAFLRQAPSPTFQERLDAVEQVARALAHCHKKQVAHGALGPHAVLVRRHDDKVQAKHFNFQLGAGHLVRGTVHASALSSEPWAIYQAPELREDAGRPTPLSDIFSLGALAYFVFTGLAPAENVVDLDARLQRDGHLDPLAARDDVPKHLAEGIAFATERLLAARADDAHEWIELVLQNLVPQEITTLEETDPLEARTNDVLGGDLSVTKILGYGATSRVLEVERASDRRSYALKVSLAIEHDDRLREEARVLQSLEHTRIVQVVEEPRTLCDRVCLLLTHAGDLTLQRFLAKEGSVSLDYASRFGDDLLSALSELERKNVVHRDIKPANVGVGTVGKQATHLTLFDFSLGMVPLSELAVGTTVYRDPFLHARGAWDAAADRWSAAITLHEMLTGVRPSIDDTPSADPRVVRAPLLAAERFDPAVRDRMVAFFATALHPDVEKRFARATEMQRAWNAACKEGAVEPVQPSSVAPPEGAASDLETVDVSQKPCAEGAEEELTRTRKWESHARHTAISHRL